LQLTVWAEAKLVERASPEIQTVQTRRTPGPRFCSGEIVTELPPGTPPVPRLPCEHFSGRGFPIRPGFHVTTGYVTDAVAQLDAMLDQGVITDAEYDSALAYQHPH
jgi:hypothetical protein